MTTSFTEEEFKKILKKKRVLLFFTAAWCGYCKMINIELEELEKLHPDVEIIKIDIERHKRITVDYGVMGIPVLFYYENGKLIRKTTGYKPLSELEKFIKD